MPIADSQKSDLINTAREILAQRFNPDRHRKGAALLTTSGKVFVAVHVEATVGRIAVCAESIAVGTAATAGDTDIELIVAVDEHGEIIPPCGMCRELISDYAPDATVILPSTSGYTTAAICDLLPHKYQS